MFDYDFDIDFDIEEIDDELYYYGSSYLIEQHSKKPEYVCNECGKCESFHEIEFETCSICGRLCCIETGRFFESFLNICNCDGDIWEKHYENLTKFFELPFWDFCCIECIKESEIE